MMYCTIYTINPDNPTIALKDTLDSLTITALGTDSIILNNEKNVHTKRLQLQERIGADIAEIMEEVTGSDSIAVKIEGCHSCMTARGIKKTTATTITTTFTGRFKTDASLQMRVMMQ